MKKINIMLLALVLSVGMSMAQDTMYVHQKVGGIAKFAIDNVDSVSFINTVTDIDGNVYKTVKIGTQTWMAENLKVTKYNDGTPISLITNASAWYTTNPAYCWYNNDINNKDVYGALYNWYVVNTTKLAPSGWHIPTDAEWNTLITYLGGNVTAVNKLMSTTDWITPGTNESGFCSMPSGFRRESDGIYFLIKIQAEYWTSISSSSYMANHVTINASSANQHANPKTYGFSVRCVKD